MTEEEIQALKDAKEAAETRAAEVAEQARLAKEAADEANSKLTNVVEELKTERQKKNEALEKLNINNPPTQDGPPDVATLIEQELQKRERERQAREVQEAVDEFRKSKTEFQADTSGIVFDKFKKELAKFNFSDVTSKEQAKARLEEVYRFANNTRQEEDRPEYEGSPRVPGSPPAPQERLSAEAEEALKATGMDKERFSKLSNKYPDAISGLGFGGQ